MTVGTELSRGVLINTSTSFLSRWHWFDYRCERTLPLPWVIYTRPSDYGRLQASAKIKKKKKQNKNPTLKHLFLCIRRVDVVNEKHVSSPHVWWIRDARYQLLHGKSLNAARVKMWNEESLDRDQAAAEFDNEFSNVRQLECFVPAVGGGPEVRVLRRLLWLAAADVLWVRGQMSPAGRQPSRVGVWRKTFEPSGIVEIDPPPPRLSNKPSNIDFFFIITSLKFLKYWLDCETVILWGDQPCKCLIHSFGALFSQNIHPTQFWINTSKTF